MTASPSRRALVIGGSLAGLFTATTLRTIGWDVQVFERSPRPLDGRGGGIVLQPDVLDALRFARISPTALGVESGDRIHLDRDDKVVRREYLPQIQTSWNMLHAATSRSLPESITHRGEELTTFEQDGDLVRAYFRSGRSETGGLLIGADGPLSTVRSKLVADTKPAYAGYVAWRGLVLETALPERARMMLSGTFAFQQGLGHLMLGYMVPGEDGSTKVGARRWNWVWYRKVKEGAPLAALMVDGRGQSHTFSVPPGAVKGCDIAELRNAAKELLAPTFQEVMEATRQPFVQCILDLQVPAMVFGRTLLLGDAASIPRPHTAGSTAKAAANAVSLARALQYTDGDLDEKLHVWEEEQLREGTLMSRWGICLGNRLLGIQQPETAPMTT